MMPLCQELESIVSSKQETFRNSELIKKYKEMEKLGIAKPRENTLPDIADKQATRLKHNSMEQHVKHGIRL